MLAALSLSTSTAFAQPGFFEPTQGYYKARGPRVTAAWTIDRDEVPEDGVLTATLTIRGAVNPHEIVRPDLAKVRDDGRFPYAERFQIENVPVPAAAREAKEVSFVYLLRPRSREVDKLPSLDFWYDTGKKAGNPFQKTVARGPKIVVTAATRPKPPAAPLHEPERLFHQEAESYVLGREPFQPGWFAWLLLFVFGILFAGAWYAGWRRVYPAGSRLARRRRSRAARRATDAIHRAHRTPEAAGTIAAAMIGYLRARFPISPGSTTPSELELDLLRQPSLPAPEIEAGIQFLRRCDEARFAPHSDDAKSLAIEAETLLERWEAVE